MNKKILMLLGLILIILSIVGYSYTVQGNLLVNGWTQTSSLNLTNSPSQHKVYDNSTCTIITGDTVTMAVC